MGCYGRLGCDEMLLVQKPCCNSKIAIVLLKNSAKCGIFSLHNKFFAQSVVYIIRLFC